MKPNRPAVDLTGQIAIVTGGGRGLGRVMAQALAAAGAAVAVVARSKVELTEISHVIDQDGGRAIAVPVDVTDRDAVERMVQDVEGKLGPVDLLVNNAGVIGPIGPIWDIDPDDWWHAINVDLRGPFLCARAVLPSMIQRRRGRIINVAS